MALKKSFVDEEKVSKINDRIYEQASVDRVDLMDFLKIVDTTDAMIIVREVKQWLLGLHEDPKFSKVRFPHGDIEAILGDLDSYGKVSTETIMEFKEQSSKTLPIS